MLWKFHIKDYKIINNALGLKSELDFNSILFLSYI